MTDLTNRLLWLIYFALLAVLFPHTAWAFGRFEPETRLGQGTAWVAAFAFEAAIAALTHRLAKHIESTPRYTAGRVALRRFAYRYANPYAIGLSAAVTISALANLAHAVEFGRTLRIVRCSSLMAGLYSVGLGGILPVSSLLFARVLSEVDETEHEQDEKLAAAKQAERQARRELARVQRELEEANVRFAAAGDLFARLFAAEKRDRILFVHQQWPELSNSAIAVITESSPGYVSDVLSRGGA
jgi:hypothetical protein